MNVQKGVLVYHAAAERYEVLLFQSGERLELHCGDCFAVKIGGKYVETRMECGTDWYLVGMRGALREGLEVRI